LDLLAVSRAAIAWISLLLPELKIKPLLLHLNLPLLHLHLRLEAAQLAAAKLAGDWRQFSILVREAKDGRKFKIK
jgi:hypothetical protein